MAENYWDVLRAGDTEQALHKMREAYQKKPTASNAMELGVGYLWVGDYDAAWRHFDGFNRTYPNQLSVTYGMAGVAKWCLNEPEAAVEEWNAGLQCEFADAAGGIKLPLLLYFVSVAKPTVFLRSEAETLVNSRANEARAEMWPGPLAKYVLGWIDQDRLRSECWYKTEATLLMRRFLADFYVAVLKSSSGNWASFVEMAQIATSLSWSDFDINKRVFFSMIWQEEFFLARHESQRKKGDN
jgi:lipoprotein NlpI